MSSEFTTVSSSSFDPAALATKLTEKSAEGWTVVSIVSTGGDVTVFLSKDSSSSTSRWSSTSSSSTDSSGGDVPMNEPEPVPYEPAVSTSSSSEPAGWASAPEPSRAPAESSYSASSVSTPARESEPSYTPAPEPAYTPAPAAEPAYTPAASSTPSVPAGWYADPAGRFELRYWDGGTWTEHVSRAGQQYTDPPVA